MKIFAPYVIVYGHTRTKMIIAATSIEKSKNEDRTLITKTHELSDEILFDFRLRRFQLPVSKKQPTSGLGSKSEVENMTLHNFRVNSIHPQSFIQIGRRVSEILKVPPKMNAILESCLLIATVFQQLLQRKFTKWIACWIKEQTLSQI